MSRNESQLTIEEYVNTLAVLPQRPLAERSLLEGNILEYPIFKLSNKEAKPKRVVQDATGKLVRLVDPEDYVSVFEFVAQTAEGPIMRRVVIKADVHSGYPTVLGLEMLAVLVEKAREMDFSSRIIPITLSELARYTGRDDDGKTLQYIRDQLIALASTKLSFYQAWLVRPNSLSIAEARRNNQAAPRAQYAEEAHENILTRVRFRNTESDKKSVKKVIPIQTSLALPGIDSGCLPESFVEFGGFVFQSLKDGYCIPLDLEYMGSLPTDTAKRLYAYLTKRDYAKGRYSEDFKILAARIGLKANYASKLRESLEPALQVLTEKRNGKRFLKSYEFLQERVSVTFAIVEPGDVSTWERLKRVLATRIRPDLYTRWIAPLKPESETPEELVLSSPDAHTASFVGDNYRTWIEQAAGEVLGRPLRLILKPAETI